MTTTDTPDSPVVDAPTSSATSPKAGGVLVFVTVVLVVIVGAVLAGVPTSDLTAITVATTVIVGAATTAYLKMTGRRSDRD